MAAGGTCGQFKRRIVIIIEEADQLAGGIRLGDQECLARELKMSRHARRIATRLGSRARSRSRSTRSRKQSFSRPAGNTSVQACRSWAI